MLGTMMQYPLALTPVLERAGKLFGRTEIVSRRPDRTLHRSNYGELYRRSRALASALAGAGLGRGERVASLMWNHVWHLEAYFGVPCGGCVLHTLNPRLHPDELAYIANHGGDRILIVDEALLPVYEKFREKTKLERVFVVSASGGRAPAGYDDYERLLERGAGDFRFPALEEDEAAVMCYTSGTTGQPKGVVYSHRALVLHSLCAALPECMSLSQADCIMPVVPMFHANAWGCPCSAAISGAKQVLPGPNLDPASLLELLDGERVTRAAGVPTVWLGILELLERQPGRWRLEPSMRALVGGAAMPESMVRACERHGMEVRHAWGMTEMTPIGALSSLKPHMLDWPEEERVRLRAKQGMALPFVELRAMEGDSETPWDGRSLGELQARGPWVAARYYNMPEQQRSWTEDGWFRTGDVVTIDAEGFVKIADRTKDLIKSGGEWISSVDLENALMGHPAVREAAVIAIPHPKWQERPLAAVVLKDGASASEQVLREHLASRFSPWQLPDAFVFVAEIPRTSVGKFHKSRLREKFASWQWEQAAGEPA